MTTKTIAKGHHAEQLRSGGQQDRRLPLAREIGHERQGIRRFSARFTDKCRAAQIVHAPVDFPLDPLPRQGFNIAHCKSGIGDVGTVCLGQSCGGQMML